MVRKPILAIAALGALVLPLIFGPAAEAGPVVKYQTVFNTDVVYAGYGGMRGGDGTGQLVVAGVSGTVTKALLYWHGPTNLTDPAANAAVTFNGHAITGTNIGVASANCWEFDNSQAYRADVTSFVHSNGTYSLADFVKPNVDMNGVSLIVFFDDGNAANNRDVVLFNGNDSNVASSGDPAGWDVNLTGINYTSGSATLDLHVGDGQTFDDGAITVNGTDLAPNGPIFSGDSTPHGTIPPNQEGSLWDIKSFDVTSLLSPGPNTLHLTTTDYSDCLSLVVAAVNLPAGAAPDQPTTTTTTTTTTTEPATTTTAAPVVAAKPAFTG
jgi:hypothetical protein